MTFPWYQLPLALHLPMDPMDPIPAAPGAHGSAVPSFFLALSKSWAHGTAETRALEDFEGQITGIHRFVHRFAKFANLEGTRKRNR